MAKTEIQWTDYTWNPVTGCTKVSQGCKNCYAETIANRFWKGREFTDVIMHEDRLEQPLHLKKPRMIFVNSMSDLFHKVVPFEFIEKVVAAMATNPRHIYQILTKRPEQLLWFCDWMDRKLKNQGFSEYNGKHFEFSDFMWIGVSVENQKTADERIPQLLQTPAKIRWLSCEPLLSEIDLSKVEDFVQYDTKISWVVVGCESGPKRRECKIEWVESLVGQCKDANVPVFVKQLQINGKVVKEIDQFPKHLQIREYPV